MKNRKRLHELTGTSSFDFPLSVDTKDSAGKVRAFRKLAGKVSMQKKEK
jgi:hypothetical protein